MLFEKESNFTRNIQISSTERFESNLEPYKIVKPKFIEIPLLIPEKGLVSLHGDESKAEKRFYHGLDCALGLFIISPLVVGHWRGLWVLMDNHSKYFPTFDTFMVGAILHCIFLLTRSMQQKFVAGDDKTACEKIQLKIYRLLYVYCFSFAIILQWRAGWLIIDSLNEITKNNKANIVAGLCCIIPLVLLKSTRNLIAAPQVIVMDYADVTFAFPTRFRSKSSQKNTPVYLLDCLFSVFVIGTLVVFVWRGAWVLFDMYLFPEDEPASAFGSLILGYTLAIMAFLLQPLMQWLCANTSGLIRIIIADFYLIFSFIGTVNVWRGIWMVLNLYYLPDDPEISCWSTHIVFLVLLILLKCSNSVLVRGVYIDAEEPGGKCVVFPCYYLRLYFQNERAKKHGGLHSTQIESLLSPSPRRKSDCDFTKIKPIIEPHLCTCHITSDNNKSTNHITVSIPLVHPIKESENNYNNDSVAIL